MMGLRERVQEQAKTLAELFTEYQRWKDLFKKGAMGNQQAYAEARDTRKFFEEGKWVSVDAVLNQLDKAIMEIKRKVVAEDWAWFFYAELGYRITDSDEDKEALKKAMIGLFDKALTVLGGENQK